MWLIIFQKKFFLIIYAINVYNLIKCLSNTMYKMNRTFTFTPFLKPEQEHSPPETGRDCGAFSSTTFLMCISACMCVCLCVRAATIWFDNGTWFSPLTCLWLLTYVIILTKQQRRTSIKDFKLSPRSNFIYNQNLRTKQQKNLASSTIFSRKQKPIIMSLNKSIISCSTGTTYNHMYMSFKSMSPT